jgi:hypothetical protein
MDSRRTHLSLHGVAGREKPHREAQAQVGCSTRVAPLKAEEQRKRDQKKHGVFANLLELSLAAPRGTFLGANTRTPPESTLMLRNVDLTLHSLSKGVAWWPDHIWIDSVASVKGTLGWRDGS